MNKSKIEWCDYTWNPVTGCKHGCAYCYAEKISKRFTGNFDPHFHVERLEQPLALKKPSRIFAVSMGDLFGEWVPGEWIEKVFDVCEKAHWHKFMFLTKNPSRYWDFHRGGVPSNVWLGASIGDDPDDTTRVVNSEKGIFQVSKAHSAIDALFNAWAWSFVSIEPLRMDITSEVDLAGLHWVIVGAQTGPGAVKPKPEWVQRIIEQCRAAGTPLFLKDNLHWPERIQEYPKELQ